ncbi:MAG: hypothetical protein OER56_01655 [Hyphomicrobiales bacterium]|nr:hypothetical protein [Hyphomicrobiales bacterium]
MTDDDHLAAWIADMSKMSKIVEQTITLFCRFNDQNIRRFGVCVGLNGSRNTTKVDIHMGLNHAAVSASTLHCLCRTLVVAECGNIDAGDQRHHRL